MMAVKAALRMSPAMRLLDRLIIRSQNMKQLEYHEMVALLSRVKFACALVLINISMLKKAKAVLPQCLLEMEMCANGRFIFII